MPKVKGAKPVWQAATRPNGLLLSQATILNSEQLQPVFDWFSHLQILNSDFPVYRDALTPVPNPSTEMGDWVISLRPE